jgi:hypothetical protein
MNTGNPKVTGWFTWGRNSAQKEVVPSDKNWGLRCAMCCFAEPVDITQELQQPGAEALPNQIYCVTKLHKRSTHSRHVKLS